MTRPLCGPGPWAPFAALVAALAATVGLAGDATVALDAEPVVLPALDTVGIQVPYAGDDNTNGVLRVEYRVGDAPWREGHPGLRVESFYGGRPEERREFATRLFDLRPGTVADVRATFADPDGVTGPATRTFRVATRPEPVVSNAGGRTWHVYPQAATGTLAEAVAKAAAGDTILLHDGEHVLTNRYALVIKASGTPEAPLVIRAADGARPVVRGPRSGLEGPGAVAWHAEGPALPGVYSAPLAAKPAQVYYRTDYLGLSQSLTNLAAGRAVAQGKPWTLGTFGGWHWADGRLFVKIPARWNEWSGPAEDPSAAGVEPVVPHYWGLMPKGSNVVIDGVTFRYLDQPIYLQVTDEGQGNGLVVRNCRFECFNNGLHVYQASSASVTNAFRGVLIDRCEFRGSPTYWYRDWTLGHDLYSTQGVLINGIPGSVGGVIRDCVFSDCENGVFIGYGNPEAGRGEMNPGWVIEGCRFDRIGDDSIELEGPSCNQVVQRNVLTRGHTAFGFAPAGGGPVWVLRNVVYYADRLDPDGRVHAGGAYDTPYGIFKFNSGYNFPSRYIRCVVYHNDVLVDTGHSAITAVMTKWPTQEGLWWLSRNNSFVLRRGPDRALRVYRATDPRSLQVLDLDYDNLWVPGTNALAAVGEPAAGKVVVYPTLAEFREAGYEAHGLNVLPAYADPAAGDFDHGAASPLRDRGVRLPGINDSFRGAAPDVGSREP